MGILPTQELHEVKRKSAALQMQQFVGEEKNDLLDYLRSLQPEKVKSSHIYKQVTTCSDEYSIVERWIVN